MSISDSVKIDLALQGGGAHGAFTWGVLDRLLEEELLHIDGISGTSAGAMNAAVLACGFTAGGAAGARYSSPPPMYAPAWHASSATRTCRWTRCWRRPVCRPCTRR